MAIGLQVVKMQEVIINQLDFFVDYLLPDNISYQLVEKQHRKGINPALNKRYKLNCYIDTIYIATHSKPKRSKHKFNPLLRIYNKSKQLEYQKMYPDLPGVIARFELALRKYKIEKENGGQLTLAKWIQPVWLLKIFYDVYTEVFLFTHQNITDPLFALKGLSSYEFADYARAHLIQSLLNEGYTVAGIIEFLSDHTELSDTTIMRSRNIYKQYSGMLNNGTSKSTMLQIKHLIKDEIINITNQNGEQ
jgi:hypothetical protein